MTPKTCARSSTSMLMPGQTNEVALGWPIVSGDIEKLDGSLQTPVALLTCNFAPPVDDKPSLLTHEDVLTLFHEFGHGLHHMLTKVDEPAVAGINGVPWDAVELPSQFLENWCWESAALDLVSGHFESGERLPAELLQKLRDARNFQSGLQMVRQLEFSVFDLRLHSGFGNKGKQSIQDVLDEVRRDVAVVQPPSFNRFQHSFSHIFAADMLRVTTVINGRKCFQRTRLDDLKSKVFLIVTRVGHF